MNDPQSIVRACFDAYARQDRAALEAVIGDPFSFTSPLDNRLDRATYFEHCWPNSGHIAGFDIVEMVSAGEKVFVTYEGSATDGHGFRNTEVHTVRGDKIVEVEVYFGWSLPHEAPEGGFVEQD